MTEAGVYEFRLQRFCSDDWPERTRLESWRELLSRKLMRTAVSEVGNEKFRAEACMRALPGVRFGWGLFSPTLHQRTREIVAEDNDDFFFVLNLEGHFIARQSRRENALEPGEATLLACSELGSYVRPDSGNMLCVRVTGAGLTQLLPDAYDRVARVVPAYMESLPLLRNYAYALNDNQALVSPQLRQIAVTHLYDLVALTLGASRDAAEEASKRGLSAARLSAIKRFVAANLTNQELSVAVVATHHRLSPRQVQRLFETMDVTFSDYVQRERLAMVHLKLTDPAIGGRSIGDIAMDCGFGDLSHFNRAFRRRYGASPSEVRGFEPRRN